MFKKCFAYVSIGPYPYELKSVLPYICFGYGLVAVILFDAVEANSFQEYAESFYPITTLFFHACSPMALIDCESKMLELINHFEQVIESRKYFQNVLGIQIDKQNNEMSNAIIGLVNPITKPIYNGIYSSIEKWTRILIAFGSLSLLSASIPFFVASYFLYFATDLGREAFWLPFSIW